MIRTRDFLVFSGTAVFLLTALLATVAGDIWNGEGQAAAVVKFTGNAAVSGAVSDSRDIDREGNIARLRGKIAAGEGGSPLGEPVFTSVDDIATTAPAITDSSVPASVLLGHTVDGSPLMSEDLWRFVGFAATEQIGAALNDVPIYGSRPDTFLLDACGGADEGFGYRLYLQPGKEIVLDCFVN